MSIQPNAIFCLKELSNNIYNTKFNTKIIIINLRLMFTYDSEYPILNWIESLSLNDKESEILKETIISFNNEGRKEIIRNTRKIYNKMLMKEEII